MDVLWWAVAWWWFVDVLNGHEYATIWGPMHWPHKNLAKKERRSHPEPGRWWSKQIQLTHDEGSKNLPCPRMNCQQGRKVTSWTRQMPLFPKRCWRQSCQTYAHCGPGVSCWSLSSPQDLNGIQPFNTTRIHQVFCAPLETRPTSSLPASTLSTGVYLF